MSRAWAKGSTRAWRRVRVLVLARDKYVCQIKTPGVCTTLATEADHIIRKADGGTDEMHNLRAACAPCNLDRNKQPPNPLPTPRTPW